MLTGMTEADWDLAVEVFRAVRSRRGDKGRGDRKFLEALHYFTVNNVTWRALPSDYGLWNSVWKRFWRLSKVGVFEAFFEALASLSETAHLVQMFDSTIVRAHVSAAGAKGAEQARGSSMRSMLEWRAEGNPRRRSAVLGAGSRPRSISKPILTATHSPSC